MCPSEFHKCTIQNDHTLGNNSNEKLSARMQYCRRGERKAIEFEDTSGRGDSSGRQAIGNMRSFSLATTAKESSFSFLVDKAQDSVNCSFIRRSYVVLGALNNLSTGAEQQIQGRVERMKFCKPLVFMHISMTYFHCCCRGPGKYMLQPSV